MIKVKRGYILFFVFIILTSCKKETEVRGVQPEVNNPPEVLEVTVTPSTITASTSISLSVRARDPDGDRVELKYKWLVNGREKGNETNMLMEGEFERGDTITAIITPSDGKSEGEPYRVDLVVKNQPPEVKSIELLPSVPTIRDSIKVNAVAVDPEGDPVQLRYAWFVEGKLIEDETSPLLPNRYFKKGSTVYAEVIPFDRESTGPSLISPQITISNTPPQITSSPPDSIAGNRYSYKVTATDPDGDAVSYSLENAPDGMTIDPKTGLITWQIQPDQKGEYTFTIIAEDTDGARSLQTVTLNF